MTLSQIKAQVEALCRKYAKEIELYLLGKVSAEFCDEVADALTNPKACPRSRTPSIGSPCCSNAWQNMATAPGASRRSRTT